jgi:serine/threonine protein kinase
MDKLQQSRTFGDYLIQEKLGSGGMASVFHAFHARTNEEVALKILHEHYADDPHIRKRLEHEARIVMRLAHPSIVPVLDYGEAENRPYLVMPYMEGGSLAQLFSKPRLVKHETTLKLLMVLADGLDYAHSQEVVHRDLKLENILLSKKRVLAISDFGIAQSTHTTRITMTGQILGTPQYLAPETLDSNGQLNYRADLYALAIMAYLMLTGYFPFTAKDPLSIAIKHRTEIAPTPSLVNQNLPMAIDPVFVKALAKNPEARYYSAQAFVEALDEAFSQADSITTTIFVNEANPVSPTQAAMLQADVSSPDSLITKILPPEAEAIPAVHLETQADIRRAKKQKLPRVVLVALLLLFLCAGSSLSFYAFNGGFFPNAIVAESSEEVTEALAEASEEAAEALAESSEEGQTIDSTGFNSLGRETATSSPTASRTPRASSTPRGNNTAQGDDEGEASNTPTLRLTNTARPTNTPRPTNTSRPSNTAQPEPSDTARPLPTNTPRPLPTNTPQPQPTSVPPTNPPAPTAVPPTSVPPTNPPPPTTAPQPTAILDPVLDPVNTLIPICVPIPLVRTCP